MGRRLLASGGLSWRWLRDEDEDCVPILSAKALPRPDEQTHKMELRFRQAACSSRAFQRLTYFDACLKSDALWPACTERVALAARLVQTKAALGRRCTRFLDEVVAPLLRYRCSEEQQIM